jgi:hypothetical protein
MLHEMITLLQDLLGCLSSSTIIRLFRQFQIQINMYMMLDLHTAHHQAMKTLSQLVHYQDQHLRLHFMTVSILYLSLVGIRIEVAKNFTLH